MKVFLYVRVSSEEQAKHGYSLDAQEEALKAFCEKHDHVILGIYRDEGISGRKPYTKRPAIMQLLNDLPLVKPDIILFTKLDRWFRNIKEYYKVQDILDKNKVDWKAINEEYDTSTASGRLYVNIKLSIAQDEADRTSERIKDVHSQLTARGQILGGSAPLGYKVENKHIVFGDDIHITKDAINHFLTYQSITLTTRYINEKYNLRHDSKTFRSLFRNTILKGEHRGNPDFCEPLLTSEEFERVQSAIKKNVKWSNDRKIYLFSGIVFCPICGRRLSGSHNCSKKYYRCAHYYDGNCSMKKVIREEYIEQWLLDNIEEDFKVNVTMKPKEKKESPAKYKERLKRLNEIYIIGNVSEYDYKRQAKELNEKIAELSREVQPKEISFDKSWKEVYQMLDDQHKRAFWRGLIKGIKPDEDMLISEIMY